MKARRKRMLAILLAASMTLTMMPASVFASIEGIDEQEETDTREIGNAVGSETNSENGLFSVDDSDYTNENDLSVERVGFTYDERTKESIPKYALYVELNQAIEKNDNYMVVVSGPEEETPKFSWFTADVNGDLSSDGKSIYRVDGETISRGKYTLSLYAYEGDRLKAGDAISFGTDGIPKLTGHIFKEIYNSSDTTSVYVFRTGDINGVYQFPDFEGASGTIYSKYPDDDGNKNIIIGGRVANLKNNQLKVGLVLRYNEEDCIKSVMLEYNPENKSWSSNPENIQLFPGDEQLPIKCDIDVIDAWVFDTGAPVIQGTENENLKSALGGIRFDFEDTFNTGDPLAQEVREILSEQLPNRDHNADRAVIEKATETSVSEFYYAAQPYLVLDVQNYDLSAKKLELNISAKYDLIATTQSDGNDLKYEENINAVILESEEIDCSYIGCNLIIPIPKGFFTGLDENENIRYVEHSGTSHYHKGQVNIDGTSGTDTLSLCTPHLGTFVISDAKDEMTVELNRDCYFRTLKEAIDDLEEEDSRPVRILKNCDEQIVLDRALYFDLEFPENAYDLDNITAASGYSVAKDYEAYWNEDEGRILIYIIKCQKKPAQDPSGPSTPSTPTPTPSVTPEPTDTPVPSVPQDIEFVDPRQEKGLLERTSGSKNCHLNLEMNVEGEDFTFAYTSSDPDVATVTDDGVIRYQGVGETTVTVTATDADGRTYTREITVRVTQPGQPTFTPSNNISKESKTITVTTSTVRGADGFQVQYSLKNLKKTKKGAKKASFLSDEKAIRHKIKTNKGGVKYYVRVRAYQIVNGKKVYSDWSPVKTIKSRA